MQEIKCPNCGEVFQVDESGYAQIVQQVRDKEFAKELERREQELNQKKEKDMTIARIEQEKSHNEELSKKDSELAEKDKIIEQLKSQITGNDTEKKLAITEALQKKQIENESLISKKDEELVEKDKIIEQLKFQITENDTKKKLAVSEALQEKQKESESLIIQKNEELAEKDKIIEQLKSQITGNDTEKKLAVTEAVQEKQKESESLISKKDEELSERGREIDRLKAQLDKADTERKLAVTEAVQEKEKELSDKVTEIAELKGQLSSKETESRLKEKSIKEQYEDKLKQKDEQIEYYKDFKARQSTKMVGESLEQHCLNEFNSIRMTAFPNAYFEKDNDVKNGSKGDFIFKETSPDGTEFISIMFEMKNEMDNTTTKHKNEDFFKELDKDRKEKGCEYAVLVSLLEMDNDYYNTGIVDVSYRYDKMYVIRPQCFIPMITLLRNAALNSLKYQQELQIVKNQQLDILHFEENMQTFKKGFANNYELASRKFKDAIADIDKTIKALEKTKEDLMSSDRNLRLANDKAQDLSIKKLTKNAPSVKAMFDDINNAD